MTLEQKKAILSARVQGTPIREIAQQLNPTPPFQSVQQYLKKLKPDDMLDWDKGIPFDFPELSEEQLDVILQGIALWGARIPEIHNYAVAELQDNAPDETTIHKILIFVSASQPKVASKMHYKVITDWMIKHILSTRDVERIIGIRQTKLTKVLQGKNIFNWDTAIKLKKLTGLSLEEIFQEDIRMSKRRLQHILPQS